MSKNQFFKTPMLVISKISEIRTHTEPKNGDFFSIWMNEKEVL